MGERNNTNYKKKDLSAYFVSGEKRARHSPSMRPHNTPAPALLTAPDEWTSNGQ